MTLPQFKKLVIGVAIASLIVYLIMGSLTNGESLANPNGIQLAVELLVIVSFFTAAILEKKCPSPAAGETPQPQAAGAAPAKAPPPAAKAPAVAAAKPAQTPAKKAR